MTTKEKKVKKVLVISFAFPPTNSIAALRTGKFAKYLPEFGWEPIILTSDINRGEPQSFFDNKTVDISIYRTNSYALASTVYQGLGGERVLSSEIKQPIHRWKRAIHRMLKIFRPLYTMPILERAIVDPIGWYFSARKKGLLLAGQQKYDIIFSSSGPPTAHFIASYLHKKTGIPWVAEFRDLWVDPYNNRGKLHDYIERQMEKTTLKRSCHLVAASKPHTNILKTVHNKEVALITNGFDVYDYRKQIPLTSKFTITYTGNIYPGKRDPTLLFIALSELCYENQIYPGEVVVRFFGGKSINYLKPLVEKYGLGEIVELHDTIPLQESIKRQMESTILLLLEWNDSRAAAVYSGKIFEYLGASRPILAVGYKPGVIGELLARTGTGIIVDNVKILKENLITWIMEWRQQDNVISNWSPVKRIVNRYTRREQTKRLAQLLDRIYYESSSPST